jgi:hypothetical protein
MTGVPTSVDSAIEAAIDDATAQGLAPIAAPRRPADEAKYILKYTGAKHGGRYPPGPNYKAPIGLYVSPSPGFTWGAGVFACPVAYPVSGAIYGRCGIVAELPTTRGWRIFNATDPSIASLYVFWAQQQPLYPMLTLTAHANWANHLLRNLFKSRFRIDIVVFPPDEFHAHYTDRTTHRWLAISEWSGPGKLASGVTAMRPVNARLTIILAEEFEPTQSGIRRRALIGPTPTLPTMLPTAADVIAAYQASNLLWVGA